MSSRLSNAFRAHPVNLDDNHFDMESAQEVPDSHLWPSLTDYPSDDIYGTESVPIIDLMNPNAQKLIGNACETWGIFQILNHGVPTHLLQDFESEGKRLFYLPVEQKLKAARSPSGVSGYGCARISSFVPKFLWSEGFTIVDSPIEHARKLWPLDHKHFCDVIEEYHGEMKKLASRLLWVMLGALGISKEELKWVYELEGASAVLQLNSYPPCPKPDRAMGLNIHTDSCMLTILYQNNTAGLQILSKDGFKWVTVPSICGTLVVLVGDLLHILSNARYKASLHRAVVHRTYHRFSAAYLCGPPTSTQISPFQKLTSPSSPPLYEPVTWTEYLKIKAKHHNNALSAVRLSPPQQKDGMND